MTFAGKSTPCVPGAGAVAGDIRPLTARAAFVLHMTLAASDPPDALAGRVEHVVSGRSLRFTTAGELVAFLQEQAPCPRR